ncbi:bifunctional methylenetetrahydrofolate dehydrogenase/cyclohydrolase 2, mitochondrial isoform X2 [Grus americana]|uniref:bifunctional methylenetetrahydrofolate dehydrogenase/cyclohydrolase 2, mitochondrial isoform X2 n=1 Tax=Grus americana TaxID=9117 RepID=UPI002407E825|nr:bifunctional methylenetetrahydrofolate dehydrogenase/cyclohydrolase 2, mitochondrial isoform X2 [Grus americana]
MAAVAAFSSSSVLRPGLAPLRRWRPLSRPAPRAAYSTSSSPRSAASDEATIISGTKLAKQVLKEVQRDVESWISFGNKRPHLTVILVGDNPASHIYVRNKIKAAAAVGISSEIILRPKDVSQEELLDMTVKLNKDSTVSGLLVQLPLPDHIDERTVCNTIAPEKDVDGFHIMNIGRLCLDQPSIIPATAAAVWEIIKRTGIQTFGKNVVVAGRSKNVGMPISMLLHTDGEHERPGGDATVTITHRYTPKEQLKIHTRLADIVIVAAGIPKLITTDMVKEGAAVIDVGINHIHDPLTGKTKLVGDVDFEAMGALSEESAITVSSLSTDLWNNWTKNNAEVDYTEQPKLLKLMQTCLEEHHSYCINGLCAFHSELRKPICKCLAGYNGERCEHLTLNSYARNSYERYIAVGIGVGILTSGILAIIYCYVRKSMDRGWSIRKRSLGGSQRYSASPSTQEAICEQGRSLDHGRCGYKSLPPPVRSVLLLTKTMQIQPQNGNA